MGAHTASRGNDGNDAPSAADLRRRDAAMNVRLIAVGKVRERYVADAIADFRTRLKPYHRLEEIEVRAADGADPARAVASEGDAILKHVAPADRVWLLERTGEPMSSEELSRRIERLPHEGVARLTLVVAGTYGASDALLARADVRWSLSRLTFLHEWARAIVLEQLYRAAKIARDEPYHH
jgi:23S rRNA (pseudouridine1915-N3)-methyltransferase